MVTPQEEAKLAIAAVLGEAAKRYSEGHLTATEFIGELTGYMSADVVFRSNYVPSWEPLRPLFAECRGIEQIVARYDYENAHETILEGSGLPVDPAVAGDVLYYTQRETARFFDGRPVTWDMVTKVTFYAGLITRIDMFVDPAPIEASYPAQPHA